MSIISTQYDVLARQIREQVENFLASGIRVQEKMTQCQFDLCTTLLLREMFQNFRDEVKASPISRDIEMQHLSRLSQEAMQRAQLSIVSIDTEFLNFKTIFDEIRKLSLALEIVNISGKIEVAKLKESSDALLGLLDDLATFKVSLRKSLKEVDTLGLDLLKQTRDIKSKLN